ncbi:hypothetical protein [Halogeometricum limi]|uniref:Uncharacterized protein n=1 Tax=Halogeometricum limi TaxID=555875 RepID=A0A1I6GK37_9EURY|nr:hypothetical protein [Halogeometricum limi]SFR42540.1 hypothetical protein SAMN04488124_1164 [Halogeometricum limi]
MERTELYHVLTLFLFSMVVLNTNFSLTFPASALARVASVVAFLVAILAPSYLLADLFVTVADRF